MSKTSFPMNEKCENFSSPDLFYAFVKINEFKKEPDFWIFPSKLVSKIIKENHLKWLKTPNKKGGKHKNNPFRKFSIINSPRYPKNWEKICQRYYKNITLMKNN